MPSIMEKPLFSTSPIVSPAIHFGTSPFHAKLSDAEGDTFSATYCFLSEKDKTMSETYDLYYKGSLGALLVDLCHEHANTTAIADKKPLTFADFYNRVCDVGRGYAELGLNPGDRVILYTNQAPLEWFVSVYGLWSHALCCVVASTPRQLEIALRETKAKVVFTSDGHESSVADIMKKCELSDTRIVTTAENPTPNEGPAVLVTFVQLESKGKQARSEHQRTLVRPEPDTTAFIVYSEQSNNNGIVLTHGNLYAAVTVITPRLVELAGTETFKSAVVEPLSYLTPFILASACLMKGGAVTFDLSPPSEGPILVACSPFAVAKATEAFGTNAIFLIFNPHHDENHDVVRDLPAGYWYSPLVASGVGLMHLSKENTVTLLPGTELRIRNIASLDTENSEIRKGEIMLKGPCVAKGYFTPNIEVGELDRNVLQNGWMPTGDVVESTPTGDIRIVGRLRLSEQT